MMKKIISSILIMFVAPSYAQTMQPDTAYMGRMLYEAKVARSFLPDFVRINPALGERALYQIQRHYVRELRNSGAAVFGYKGGFVPAASIGGVLVGGEKLESGTTIKVGDFKRLILEAEIAFEFCMPVAERVPDIAALREAVCRLRPAIEVADGAFENLKGLLADRDHLRRTLIAANVASDSVALGKGVDSASLTLETLPVSMNNQGEALGNRVLDEQAPDLWANVLWIVNEFVIGEGYTIDAGQIVLPGNMTGIHPGKPGTYHADFGELGVVTVTVEP